MHRKSLLGIIESLLWTNNTSSLEGIIWPKVIAQVEEMRNKVLALENNINDFSEIHFNSDDTIEIFQDNIYILDELLSKSLITTPKQLENLVRLLNNMLDYITQNIETILSLESVKLNNVKNSFRTIQTIIKSKITLNSEWLTQVIDRYVEVYSYIIPNLPHYLNPKKHTEYINNMDLDDFNDSNKTIFTNMIQDLKNICSQVIENTDSFKNLQENQLYELQHSLENLLIVINSKLSEIDTKEEINRESLIFPKTTFSIMLGTINKAKEKVLRYIKVKEVERNIKSHIETFPTIEKESIMNNIEPYKNFIEQINKVHKYITIHSDILSEMNHNYIQEIKIFLNDIKEKLDYIIEKHNTNNTEHTKFFYPANRLSTLITWLIEKLEFNQISFQN